MNVDTKHPRGLDASPCAGLTSSTLPEARSIFLAKSSETGVSTRNALSQTCSQRRAQKDNPHWFALRTTYGRERKAYDYLVAKGIKAFLPTTDSVKLEKGKRKMVTESRLPNIFFAYGTENEIKSFVYDNVNLPFLRFYYRHLHAGGTVTMPSSAADR